MSKRKECEEMFNKKELYLEFKKKSAFVLEDKENFNIWLNTVLEYALDIDDSEIIIQVLKTKGFVIDRLNFKYIKCVVDEEDEEKLKYAEFV